MNIKILISCHKETDYIKNEIFQPVQGGCALGRKPLVGMLRDDDGENISKKRNEYCELTTQYWAWKNLKADYYGFCHYRRYFCFADSRDRPPVDDWNTCSIPYLDEDGIDILNTSAETLQRILRKYDVIAPLAIHLDKVGIASARKQYETGPQLHKEDLDLVEQIIQERHPEFAQAAKEYLDGKLMYICNMFIMRRDIFQEYSQWLFDILEEFDRRSDMSNYSQEGLRTPGHLGERLFGIYFTYLKKRGDNKLGEYPICNIVYPEPQVPIEPLFPLGSVNIVFSSSEYFAPYCAVAIQSVLRHADPNRNYDIVVLEREMHKITKKRLKSLAHNRDNVCIRTYNTARIFYKYNLFVCEHFSVETYFRLAIPELFASYDKILYLDGDLIVKCDVAELFDTNVEGYVTAGALDVVGMGTTNGYRKDRLLYYKKRVCLKDPLMQINGGVLLMNVEKIRKLYTTAELLKYAMLGHFDLADQDVFNSLFQGQIKYLDLAWNAACDQEGTLRAYVATFAPQKYYDAYKKAIANPKIIHYAGTIKPWNDPNYFLAEEFWAVLRETPFYDIVMYRRIVENAYVYSHNMVNTLSKQKKPRDKRGLLRRIADMFMPKGTKRRECLKKLVFKLIGKEYVTPYYMVGKE